MLVTDSSTEQISFAAEIKSSSQDNHTAAEESPYMASLVRGEFTVEQYAWLVKQLQVIYGALDANCADNSNQLDLAPFFTNKLQAAAALDADWAALAARGDVDAESIYVTDATKAYEARLNELGKEWPAGLLAHHYTRYLGDLSGGRVISSVLAKGLPLTADDGLSFYEFPEIESIPAFRNKYRENLDNLDWNQETRERFIAEVNTAFELNQNVFKSLEFVL